MTEEDLTLFHSSVLDLLRNARVQSMGGIAHHTLRISCLDHCLFVSYVGFALSRRLGGDGRTIARAGLLHDLYLCRWQEERTLYRHLLVHPDMAADNARELGTTEAEDRIIRRHMWPVTLTRLPRRREEGIVCLADKICAVCEVTGVYGILSLPKKLREMSREAAEIGTESEEEKEHNCGCGHDHEHEHTCGCGHDHKHNHEHACGCGHDHEHPYEAIPVTERAENIEIDGRERAILQTVLAAGCLPVARLIATKSDEEEVVVDCLSPVYLYEVSDTLEEVREMSGVLRHLADLGLMSLDYDRPVAGYDYALYTESDLFAYFADTVEEARKHQGFLCDTAQIELGSMAVTPLGHEVCCREDTRESVRKP